MQRIILHYIAAFIILTLYGGQVCPFVESLTIYQWGSSTLVVFLTFAGIHIYLDKKYSETLIKSGKDDRSFFITLGLFIVSGLLIGTFNSIKYNFPLESDLKLLIGWFFIGFFAAMDISLSKHGKLIKHLAHTRQHLQLKESQTSLTKKFMIFAAVFTFSTLTIIFLVVVKDLDWLLHTGTTPKLAVISILKEFLFVFGVILAYTLKIVFAYTHNMKLYLSHQNCALKEVTCGNLSAQVPVSSRDEFGLMAKYTNEMINSLKDRTEMLQLTQDVSILSLASLAETRDNETGAHIMRTQRYVQALAEKLKDHPKFKHELTKENIELIYKSAPLHDVGKVGIPDNILLKPGRLTDEEFMIMKRHPNYGKKALEKASDKLGSNSFLKYAVEIAFTHHEKWDGSGYPRMLKGEEIPISGRLMAAADVYDALISKRVYKDAMNHEQAMEIIKKDTGTHFDPDVIDALVEIEDEIKKIAKEFSDENYNKRQ